MMNCSVPPVGRRRRTLVTAATVAFGVVAPGAVHAAGERQEPLGVSAPVQPRESVEHRVMPAVNVAKLLAEDAQQKPTEAPRFAFTHDVRITPSNAGTWETVGDLLLWRLRISSAG